MKNRFMKSEFFKKGFIKKICLALLITGFALGLHSQAWKKNIKKKNPDFFTIKAAFEKACKGKDIKTINGWKQFKRWEWFMENRVNEAGYLDSMKLWEAIKVKKRRFSGSKQSISDWSEIGPRDIPSGGGLGRINCIAFDPDDSDTMWIASPSGGLWKTTDAGSNWSTRTDDLPNIGVSWILIDPEDSDIMYIATGDGDGGDTYSVGVLKSTDGGDSWDTTGLQGDITSYWLIRKMLFYPGNSHTIIAATDGGIFKTTDGGTSWTETQAGYFRDIEVNASSPNIWYASVSWNGIFKSTDGGDSWAKVGSGLPVTGFQRIELDISPSTPTTIYALYCDDDNNGFFGIYRSTDSGSTWTRQASSPNLLGWAYNGDDTGGQGYYDLTLAVNPTNADEIYVGGVNLWKSSDAGVSWVCIAHWYGNGGRPYVHADHHFLEFQPGSS
ncbi:MAG: glycosyl hydrolase, partial [bacterium]|nr:glycosyl hydrolase [bacterium]